MTSQQMVEYDPLVGARVEVLFTDEQECWWVGEVHGKRGGLFAIVFQSVDKCDTYKVVETNRLCPLSSSQQPVAQQ